MAIDYDLARTFFDIIMISPLNCSLLVLNVHISVYISLDGILRFGSYGAQGALHVKAYPRILAGTRSLVFTRGFSTGATARRVEERMREKQSTIAFATIARLNSKSAIVVHKLH